MRESKAKKFIDNPDMFNQKMIDAGLTAIHFDDGSQICPGHILWVAKPECFYDGKE